MLIFDETDLFLKKQTNAVRNREILQVKEIFIQVESHKYPFACTTNLLEVLDEASLRHFTFKIKFDFITKAQVKEAFKHFQS